MATAPLRVLVVDDSALYRRFVREALTGHADVEIVGTAHNGRAALDRIAEYRPDLVSLDVEMPELDGLGVLQAIREQQLETGAIMCSSLSTRGAAVTTKALELGAFDFVLKPDEAASPEKNLQILRSDLLPKVRAFAASRRQRLESAPVVSQEAMTGLSGTTAPSIPNGLPHLVPVPRPDIVVVGISTGGPAALNQILPMLPANLPVPVLIVQHMPPLFTKSLADDLARRCRLPVMEAVDGSQILPGTIYIAPGGKQMKVGFASMGLCLRITDDPPERNCKPSVDYLFRSVAGYYGAKTLGIIMTGMGDDGTEGCRLLKKAGGAVLVQNEASCVVFGMPRNVVERRLADAVVDLNQIPAEITRLVARGAIACR